MTLKKSFQKAALTALEAFINSIREIDALEDFQDLFSNIDHERKGTSLTQMAMNDAMAAFALLTDGMAKKNVPATLFQQMFNARESVDISEEEAAKELDALRSAMSAPDSANALKAPAFLDILEHAEVPLDVYVDTTESYCQLLQYFGGLAATETALIANSKANDVALAITENVNAIIAERHPADTGNADLLDGVDVYRAPQQSGEELIKNLVGNPAAKAAFHELKSLIELEQAKKAAGLPVKAPEDLLIHFTMAGPRGVGKTTIARAIGKLYVDAGLLPENGGQVVELTESSNFGVNKDRDLQIISQAEGGLLVINNPVVFLNDNGRKASNSLLTQMDLRKGNMVVAIAGSEKIMELLFQMRPLLSDRFDRKMDFKNLTSSDLVEATKLLLAKPEHGELEIEEDALPLLKDLFKYKHERKGREFQNAYEAIKIVNLLEARHAATLESDGILKSFLESGNNGTEMPSKDCLKRISLKTVKDVANAIEKSESDNSGIGFALPNRFGKEDTANAPKGPQPISSPEEGFSPR